MPLRKPSQNVLIGTGMLLVVAVVLIIDQVVAHSGGGSNQPPRTPAPASALGTLASLSMSNITGAQVTGMHAAQAIQDPPLTAGGKPEVLFIGAEFCPICAAERWPMIIALSKFGTFTGLTQTTSAASEGAIPTWSFYKSTYTSPYLTFVPVETTTNQPTNSYYKRLEKPTPAQNAIWHQHEGDKVGFPFLDIGGRWLLTTAQYPAPYLLGASFDGLLTVIGDNAVQNGAVIDSSSAVLIKYFCSVTNEQPADVCAGVASVSTEGTSTNGPDSAAK